MRRYRLFLLIALAACTNDGPTAVPVNDPPATVVQPLFGTLYSNIREQRRILIRDEESWNVLWPEIVGSVSPLPSPPQVDFARQDVLAAAMGERRAAGYAIEITTVTTAASETHVDVVSTVPGPGCDRSEVISAPVDAVRIPKSIKPIVFRETTVVLSCG